MNEWGYKFLKGVKKMEANEKFKRVANVLEEILKEEEDVKEIVGEDFNNKCYDSFIKCNARKILKVIEEPSRDDIWDKVREITKNSDDEKWLNLTVAQLLCIVNNNC
jgi:hypothetical protein